jgi:hypothetical protein
MTSNSTNFRSEFARTDIKTIVSHHLAEFLHFRMNLPIEIGDFSQFMYRIVAGRFATQNLATSK